MEKETIKIPNLVNIENFKKVKLPKILPKSLPNLPIKFKLNKIIFILFILFIIFFLYNCKYGMFKCIENEPLPYSLDYTKSLI